MGNNAFVKVLKITPFRNLWLSQLISQVSLNLLFFSLMLRLYEMTHSNAAVSLLVLFFMIPNIALGAFAGVLVDRWGRKKVMFWSHFLRFLAVLLFVVSSESLGWVYFLVLLINVITQFFFPAEAAMIYEVVKDKKMLLTANSLFSLTFFSSVILGNILAGPALQILGLANTFFLVALSFLAASAFIFKLPKNGYKNSPVKFNQLLSDFMFGLDYLYKSPNVRKGIIFLGISQISIGILGAIAPGFGDKILHLGAAGVSLLIMAPAAAGMVLGGLIVGQYFQKVAPANLIRFGFLIAGLSLIIYSQFLPHFSLLILVGAANAFLDIPVNTIIQENTPEEIRSRVYGVVSTVIGLAGIVPIVLSGALADFLGVKTVMLFCGLIVFVIGYRYVAFSGHSAGLVSDLAGKPPARSV